MRYDQSRFAAGNNPWIGALKQNDDPLDGLFGKNGGGTGLQEAIRKMIEGTKRKNKGVNPAVKQASAYEQGFMDKCSEYGLDEEFVKKALTIIPAWGGMSGVTNQGVGLTGGYHHLLGVVPFPHAGVRFGGEGGGVTLSGPIPGIGIDTGLPAGEFGEVRPRSVWKMIGDKMDEKSREERQAKLLQEIMKAQSGGQTSE